MTKVYLDLVTNHLTRWTMNSLELLSSSDRNECGWPAMTVAPYDYGVFVTVPDFDHVLDTALVEVPDDLLQVLEFAASKGCELVRFDASSDQIEDLPVYEW